MKHSMRYITALTILWTACLAQGDEHAQRPGKVTVAQKRLYEKASQAKANDAYSEKVLKIGEKADFGIFETRENFDKLIQLTIDGKCPEVPESTTDPKQFCYDLLVRGLRRAGYLKNLETPFDDGKKLALVDELKQKLHGIDPEKLGEALKREYTPAAAADYGAFKELKPTIDELQPQIDKLKYDRAGAADAAKEIAKVLKEKHLPVLNQQVGFQHDSPVFTAMGLFPPDQFDAYSILMEALKKNGVLTPAPMEMDPAKPSTQPDGSQPEAQVAETPHAGGGGENTFAQNDNGIPNSENGIPGFGQPVAQPSPENGFGLNPNAQRPIVSPRGVPGSGGGGGGDQSGGGGGGQSPQGGAPGSGGQYQKNSAQPPEIPKFGEFKAPEGFRVPESPQGGDLKDLAAQFGGMNRIAANPQAAYKNFSDEIKQNSQAQVLTLAEFAKAAKNRFPAFLSSYQTAPVMSRATALSQGARFSNPNSRVTTPSALRGRPLGNGMSRLGGSTGVTRGAVQRSTGSVAGQLSLRGLRGQ